MQACDLPSSTHQHVFDEGNLAAEKNTRKVMIITFVMMVAEIAGGWWFNSMALLADGWHMSSHALAIGLSSLAYMAARHYASDPRFAFGTWKIEVLAGFASALFLLGVAIAMVSGSVERLMHAQPIHFPEAIGVAVLGLLVNIVCALLLHGAHHHHGHSHHHDHDHEHGHDHSAHEHHHHDLNLKSAYLHVVADAATSVLAILALVGGMLLGWNWLDPAMGIFGAVLVAVWAKGLIQESSNVLLDCEMDRPIIETVKTAILGHRPWIDSTRISDLHVWRVGRARYACIVSLVTYDPSITPQEVKALLAEHDELAHVTVEINLFPRGA